MNIYALVRRTESGTATLAQVRAGTQGQAVRKLYRVNKINPAQAASLGFSVEFQNPNKPKQGEANGER